MSTEEIISNVQELSLSEKVLVMEQILRSIKSETLAPSNPESVKPEQDVRTRRATYKVQSFDLGTDAVIDRDELYFDRGV